MLETLQRAHPTTNRTDVYQPKTQFLQGFPDRASSAPASFSGPISHQATFG